jgi:flagellar P-ring protein precursor FlgI
MLIRNGLTVIFLTLMFLSTLAEAERIKDVATLAGVRTNQLIGYGLVVGLDGSGDKSGTTYTEQSFANMLTRMGITIPPNTKLNSKNIAAVMVTANLSSFMKKGQTMDVNVSSIGDAKSLRGGMLLATPMKGLDGQVYGIAQGSLIVVGLSASGADGSNVTVNVPSGGRIPNGATVEVDIPNPFYFSKKLVYNLHTPDFTTAKRMSEAINEMMGPNTAYPMDAASVQVIAPKVMSQRVDYVSVLENIEFTPGEAEAKIIVNARTGTVVIGQLVRVKPAAVTHGNLIVTISESTNVSQPNAFSNGRTEVTPSSQVNVTDTGGKRTFLFNPGASLKDIVKAINAVGAGPGDLIAILEALKQVGAINASLVVI